MKKIIIFGNLGSGKSTYARESSAKHDLAYLDLDQVAWQGADTPERASFEGSAEKILAFIKENSSWVIEGGCSDLLDVASQFASEIVFLNLSAELCEKNIKATQLEANKYPMLPSATNVEQLIQWIHEYYQRRDTFSHQAHLNFYTRFTGKKTMYTSNTRTQTQQS